MQKLIYNWAENDANYEVSKIVYLEVNGSLCKKQILCPDYAKWKNMLQRCLDTHYKYRNPKYKEVYCCEEWKLFSNFKSWISKQIRYQEDQLDKDLLVGVNKVYSPETCVLIPRELNNFITNREAGNYYLGAYYKTPSKRMTNERSNPYYARLQYKGKFVFLGDYLTPEEAHYAWQKSKVDHLNLFKSEYKSNHKICEGLTRIVTRIQEDIQHSRITVTL